MSGRRGLYKAGTFYVVDTTAYALPSREFSSSAGALDTQPGPLFGRQPHAAPGEPAPGGAAKRVQVSLRRGADLGVSVGVLARAVWADTDVELGVVGYALATETIDAGDRKVVIEDIHVTRLFRGLGASGILAEALLDHYDPGQSIHDPANAVGVLFSHGFEDVGGRPTTSPPYEVRPEALTVGGVMAALPYAFPNLRPV